MINSNVIAAIICHAGLHIKCAKWYFWKHICLINLDLLYNCLLCKVLKKLLLCIIKLNFFRRTQCHTLHFFCRQLIKMFLFFCCLAFPNSTLTFEHGFCTQHVCLCVFMVLLTTWACVCVFVWVHWRWLMSASGSVSAQAVSILTCEDEGATILLPCSPLNPSHSPQYGCCQTQAHQSSHTHTTVTSMTLPFLNTDILMSAMKPLKIRQKHTHLPTWAQPHM